VLSSLLGEQEREERELRSASRSSGRSSDRVYMNTQHPHHHQPAYQNHFFQTLESPDRWEQCCRHHERTELLTAGINADSRENYYSFLQDAHLTGFSLLSLGIRYWELYYGNIINDLPHFNVPVFKKINKKLCRGSYKIHSLKPVAKERYVSMIGVVARLTVWRNMYNIFLRRAIIWSINSNFYDS
jgi:hypothetical protein